MPTPPPADRVLLLVARPTPSGIDEQSLKRLAAAVAERTDRPVRVAHLDQTEPTIHDALDDAVAAEAAGVLVVPLTIPDDRYLATWIARAVANWRETRGHQLDIRTAATPTSLPAIADALAGLAETEGRAVTAAPGGFRSPAWSTLEIPDRHLLVCGGPRCTVYGAGATHRTLTEATRGSTTQVTPIGCIGPCNLGPLVIDHPSGHWHQHVATLRAADLANDAQPDPARLTTS
ncbi:(2Fe-2S) ferredoxin domain-containing protein [Amycolatopsis benzoatilytica]|uniref:(2Fe-2S) ferredoxin domain-containing protein n=1 Tax=Amycolatopsis benzoatilytica TaxID=346045 RepID=UPI00037A3DDF|nr:(2Fe-2S) ferredoxin domain-containing protein [Amycolatopsis benzoatilytica]